MASVILVLTATTMLSSPLMLSVTIITISILTAKEIHNSLNSSWLPLVTILTFSSGMMTLFIYAASLSPNEKKSKFPFKLLILLMMTAPLLNGTYSQNPTLHMKTFSSNSSLILMMLILILVMISITSYSFHPNQTLTSSY